MSTTRPALTLAAVWIVSAAGLGATAVSAEATSVPQQRSVVAAAPIVGAVAAQPASLSGGCWRKPVLPSWCEIR